MQLPPGLKLAVVDGKWFITGTLDNNEAMIRNYQPKIRFENVAGVQIMRDLVL
ncbi:MAG: hypothetical protein LBP35_03340 [Candidatus Ancillula trichonymphae]|nr:hypothetical protein [Candidatus Ancillula trichonymphae]